MNVSGLLLPLTTPFVNRRADSRLLRENIQVYERHGIGGYLLLGSTGEAPLLDPDEKIDLVAAARAAIPGGKTLIAGVGLESTAATIRLARRAADCGADHVLVLPPFYFGNLMTGETLAAHFQEVADSSPVPLLLYNVPKFTGLGIPAETVIELSRHQNISGIKDSSGDLSYMKQLVSAAPQEFAILCGSASQLTSAIAAGASGAILAAGNVLPEPYVRIEKLASRGEAAAAANLQRAVGSATSLTCERSGVPGIKAAMDLRGVHGGRPRHPLLPIEESARAEMRQALDTLRERKLIEAVAL